MKKLYLLEAIVIILLIFIATFAYLRYTVLHSVDNSPKQEYRGFETFAMEVDHEEWHGKLEPGKYTKNGVLIIKK